MSTGSVVKELYPRSLKQTIGNNDTSWNVCANLAVCQHHLLVLGRGTQFGGTHRFFSSGSPENVPLSSMLKSVSYKYLGDARGKGTMFVERSVRRSPCPRLKRNAALKDRTSCGDGIFDRSFPSEVWTGIGLFVFNFVGDPVVA